MAGSLTIVLTPGTTLPDGTPITRALLRQLGTPTAAIAGTFGASFLEDDSITAAKVKVQPRHYGVEDGTLGVNSYRVVLSPVLTSLADGVVVKFRARTANTGATSLTVNGLAAKAVKRYFDSDLVAGDIKADQVVEVVWNSAKDWWQLLSLPGTVPTAGDTIPAGCVFPFGGTAAPSGYLLCDGSDVARATYANLFTAIGLNYSLGFTVSSVPNDELTTSSAHGYTTRDAVTVQNVGGALPAGLVAGTTYYVKVVGASTTVVTLHPTADDATNNTNKVNVTDAGTGKHRIASSTLFRVPDLRGRGIVGHGAGSGLTARFAGDSGGAESVALSKAQIPAHIHTVPTTSYAAYNLAGGRVLESLNSGGGAYESTVDSGDGAADGLTASAGAAHENMMPYGVVQFIVKT